MKKDWRYLMAGIFAMLFCLFTDHLIISPIVPQIAGDLHFPETWGGRLNASYSVFVALSAFIFAPFTDSLGRRWFLLWAGGVFFLSLLVCALSTNFETMLLARSMNGIAGGPLISCLWALPGDELPMERLGKAYGIVGGAFGVSASLGLLVVGYGTEIFNWRAAFFGLLMLYVPAWLYLLTWEYKPWRPRKLLLAEYLGSMYQLVRRWDRFLLLLVPFMGSLAVYTSQFFCGSFFQQNMGFSVSQTSLIFFLGGATTIIGSLCMPYINLFMNRPNLVAFGFIGGCLLWPIFFLLGNEKGFLWMIALAIFWLIFFILSFGYAGLTAHISMESTDEERGRMLSFQNVTQSFGIAAGTFWPTYFAVQDETTKQWHGLEYVALLGIVPALLVWGLLHWAEVSKQHRIDKEKGAPPKNDPPARSSQSSATHAAHI